MSGKRVKADAELSATEMEARSVERARSFLDGTAVIEERGIGTWYIITGGTMSDDMAKGHFIRCGVKGDDNAESLAARMQHMGYVRLPAQYRCTGYEADQGGGLYMWASATAYGALRDMRQRNRKTMDAMVRNHARSLQSISDNAEVSIVGRAGRVNRADAEKTVSTALRDARS